jgi:hypothetical protein
VGDWVEVRPESEILATLDADGELDALPFMPEMLACCGRRFRVAKVAHKSCDTIRTWRNRRMDDAVHLADAGDTDGLRCDGAAHDGCQAGCLLYWKEAWLRRAGGPDAAAGNAPAGAVAGSAPAGAARCDVPTLHRLTRATPAPDAPADAAPRYRCQATEMFRATRPTRWDPAMYVKDITSGNIGLGDFLVFGALAIVNRFRPFPLFRGSAGRRVTPEGEPLDLKPGEMVRVRARREILATLSRQNKHKGLSFDVEMLPYCGKTFRVLRRVDRLIDDRNGQMRRPRLANLILQGVVCRGCRSRFRMFCPRAIYPYWHEIWLERLAAPDAGAGHRAAPGD